jgi:hypothetical protein
MKKKIERVMEVDVKNVVNIIEKKKKIRFLA